MKKRQSLQLLAAPPEAVEEAKGQLTREQCPRRYCWYWKTLGFDWDLTPEQGCAVANEHPGDELLTKAGADVQPWRLCCRATGNTQHRDFYESREPHLKADGWPVDSFDIVGKTARKRRYERRERGTATRRKRRA